MQEGISGAICRCDLFQLKSVYLNLIDKSRGYLKAKE
jgi:hypothetical protein